MAVIQAKGGGLLGTLGGLATIGGALIPGAQWLTPLGMGLGMMSGSAGGNTCTNGGLINILGDILGEWQSLMKGNIASQNPNWQTKTDEQLMREWSPYNRGITWQQ